MDLLDDVPTAGSSYPLVRRGRHGTYSIVARDPETGAMGAAVQSHWFSVGSVVLAAATGVGAIATQANPDLTHKPRGLDLLRAGRSAAEVSEALLADDPAVDHRQFAVVDAHGSAVGYTGKSCIPAAGHWSGDGYVCQANMMRSTAVWGTMATAFESTRGGLTGRMLAALDAAESVGGDIRGRQSAAILIVPAEGTDADRIVDLRVEDHPQPLDELRRLVTLHDAYVFAEEGDALLSLGDFDAAAGRFLAAYRIAPDNDELRFWAGLGLITAGNPDRGVEMLRTTIAADASWHELLTRLDPAFVPSTTEALRLLAP